MRYCFTDRFGGRSEGRYESFNLALHVGDDPLIVAQNRALLSQKIACENLVFMEQVHGDSISIVRDVSSPKIRRCDALITNLPDVALCVMVADCIPVLLHDSHTQAIAAIHAGRNGVAKKIVNKTIQAMQETYGSSPEDIQVFLGPAIGSCCYEVKEDVTAGFEGYVRHHEGRIYLDIMQKCLDDMCEGGVSAQHINNAQICTCCEENYFSYRRDGVTGRFCGAIVL
ncbi:peptidoglycan editing factor PgeF [Sulfurospirillum sp. 1612]|uniref:peptidoglycan editing factor PgeF n=1 Tax=Sulfurospirillum sp. 1612 TaxID=3094835 RepID=UPI002F93918B